MLSKELFVRFLENYQKFDEAISRIDEALMGKKYVFNLYESDWYNSVGFMLDIFLESHLTDKGQDITCAFLFDDFVNIEDFPDIKNLEELYDVLKEGGHLV